MAQFPYITPGPIRTFIVTDFDGATWTVMAAGGIPAFPETPRNGTLILFHMAEDGAPLWINADCVQTIEPSDSYFVGFDAGGSRALLADHEAARVFAEEWGISPPPEVPARPKLQ